MVAMGDDVTILMVSGSLRADSTNAAVLRTAAAVAPPGVTAVLTSIGGALPLFNPDLDTEPPPPKVAELRASIDAADAVLFCVPEYAGALPGAFKNLLDWTVGSTGMEMDAKPVGWINAASPLGRAAGTHEQLRAVLGYVNARIVEDACVAVPIPRDGITNGVIEDPEIRAAIAAALTVLSQRDRVRTHTTT
jgi:chromate reductase